MALVKVSTIERDPMDADFWGRSGVRLGRGDLGNPGHVVGELRTAEGAFLWLPPILSPSQDDHALWATLASYQAALRRAPPRR